MTSAISKCADAPTLADAIARIVAQCPTPQVEALAQRLRARQPSEERTIADAIGTTAFSEGLASLFAAWQGEPAIDGPAIALALETGLRTRQAAASPVELVWTGPASEAATTLNTTAVLFRIIHRARTRLLLMSYSAFPIPGLLDALKAACERGVAVRLVLESTHDSGNRLAVDAAAPFAALRGYARFYVWPHALRPAGALMHAKAAVADGRTALITSANLTERGVDSNFELGVFVDGADVPSQIETRIAELIARNTLRELADR